MITIRLSSVLNKSSILIIKAVYEKAHYYGEVNTSLMLKDSAQVKQNIKVREL